ncbi:MAG: hypothetical protein HYR63_15580 [Proteobacteria bacterium]|nr:hypothetical protein [Pseudomonadota bacterium]MBI3499714.1 hypothetical protein [Pseudomonadota bacterium]
MQRRAITRRAVLIGLATLIARPLLAAAAQPPADLPGWRQARWGMSELELEAAFPDELKPAPVALDFDDLVVHAVIPKLLLAGRPFVVYFQLDAQTLRLAQVLLTYRGKRPTHSDYAAIARGLVAELGVSDLTLTDRYYLSVPGFSVERRWKRPTTSVSLHYVQPNFDYANNERNRLTLRYYPSA